MDDITFTAEQLVQMLNEDKSFIEEDKYSIAQSREWSYDTDYVATYSTPYVLKRNDVEVGYFIQDFSELASLTDFCGFQPGFNCTWATIVLIRNNTGWKI